MSRIEVEYVKGGKRKTMRKVYADVLVKLGAVRVVENHEQPTQSAPTYRAKPADSQVTRALKAETSARKKKAASQDDEAEPKPKARTYQRRDLQAEDNED